MIRSIVKYLRFYGGSYGCIVCGKPIRKFFKFSDSLEQKVIQSGFPYSFRRMETLNYDMCNCPFCLSNDRERYYLIYLEKMGFKSINNPKEFSILDFAPNQHFTKYLKRKDVRYISADIDRKDVDMNLDVCEMPPISDNSFDLIICSHILEHVNDPDKALRELFRIVKQGGNVIIMVPLFWDVKETIEDSSHKTEEERWRYYGQGDHVRLFSRDDFLSRIRKAGFILNEYKPDVFDKRTIAMNAISDNSILYVASKQ